MTNLSSTDSSLPLDQDATGTVTLDEVRDSNGVLVARGGKTYDKTLRFSGTSLANTNLHLRDAWTVITPEPFQSGATQWFKTLTVEHFKNYGFSAIEADPPQGSSTQYAVIVASRKPMYESVVGENGPIQSGEPYQGDSVTINGRADPGGQVQAFDGETPLGGEVTVDRNGLFKIVLEALEPATYNLQIVASNDEKSEVFVLEVQGADPTSIDDVLDDENNSVDPGGDTIEKNLTLTGKTRDGESVRLVGGVPTPVEATANGAGEWRHRFENLPTGTYSITAELIDNPRAPTDPRIFTVRAAAKAEITTITDEAENEIPEGETTPKRFLIVNCTGEKGKEIEVFNGLTPLGKDVVKDDGTSKINIGRLPDNDYAVTVRGLYTGGGESRPYPFTVDGIKSIDGVRDDEDNSVPEGESTIERNLTVSGKAEANATVTLMGGVPTSVDVGANESGDWEHRFVDLPLNTYSLTADSADTPLAPTEPWTFTVRAAAPVTHVNVTDAEENVINEGDTTSQTSLFVNCTGEKGKEIQVLDGATPLGKERVKSDGTCKIPIGPLDDKTYTLKSEGLYPGGGESRPYSFTVKTAEQSEITHVVGENNQKIENGDTTTSKYFVFWGKAPANTQMKLNGSHATPEPTDTANAEGVCVFFISQTPPGRYTFNIQESSGSAPTSPDFNVEVLP